MSARNGISGTSLTATTTFLGPYLPRHELAAWRTSRSCSRYGLIDRLFRVLQL